MTDENTRNVLLEILAEELPFSYIDPALRQMENLASEAFNTTGLKFSSIKTYATPRRLTLIVENLAVKSDDKLEEFLGPSLKSARDIHGKYTQAAVGFAAKNRTSIKELSVKKTDRGEYLSFVKKTRGEKTVKLLTEILPSVIKNISFPVTMWWEESGFRFARPIRSIIALYGGKVIKFKIADVTSSNWTVGLHTYDNGKIKIDLPESYLLKMKNKSVIVDQKERRREIERSIRTVTAGVGGIVLDESLIDEVNYLVEYPSAVLCAFDKKYLNLPEQVLATCMKKNQKCFTVNDKNGNFSNYFVGVRNGVSKHQKIVKEGYERVVTSRLEDAKFFYNNDLKKSFESNIEKLKGVVFHKEIGTVYEKVERIKHIANFFNKEFNMRIDDAVLKRAIMLSKLDLVSEMVFEYPELQGLMGKIYALKSGENEDVVLTIQQHYWPLSASGRLPTNKTALLVSMADKIDTLAANFAIGLEFSGSADPYGLRRAGVGFIRMAMESLPNEDLSGAVEKVFEFLPENVRNNPKIKNAYERLLNFFHRRIESIFEVQGYSRGEVKAVLNASKRNKLKSLGTLKLKLDSLKNAKQKGDFSHIVSLFKRINNIIDQAKKQNIDVSLAVNADLLTEDVEKELYGVVKKANVEIENYMLKNEYEKILAKALTIKSAIDNFFEKVMVMAENKTVRVNRIALLSFTKDIFDDFVDFSYLQ